MTATPIRPWTPDTIIEHPRTLDRAKRLSPKRMCDKCSLKLGDPNEIEMLDATRGWPSRDVRRECPNCQGLHTLIAVPAPLQPRQTAEDIEIESYVVVCPDRDDPQRDCFVYDRCGCLTIPTPAFDPLTSEGQRFLDQPCPASPTGKHWWADEMAEVVCATPGSCYHADHVGDHDLAVETVGFTPGVYALDASFDGAGDPVWEVVTVAEGKARKRARRDAKPVPAAS